MTVLLIIFLVMCVAAAILDHAAGMDKPKPKPRKPKKKNIFVRLGEEINGYYW